MLIQHKGEKLVLWDAQKRQRVANEIIYSAITLDKAIGIASEENIDELVSDLEEAKEKFVRDLIRITKKHHLGKIQVRRVV